MILQTTGQSLRASLGAWPGSAAATDSAADSLAAANPGHMSTRRRLEPAQATSATESPGLQSSATEMDQLFGALPLPATGSPISADWAIRSRGDSALATPRAQGAGNAHAQPILCKARSPALVSGLGEKKNWRMPHKDGHNKPCD